MSVSIYQFDGSKTGDENLPAILSDIENINEHLIWEAIVVENANLRQGTHKTKTRGEVRGGGKKPWKQKGTGRARAGSSRSPIWVGGGVTFGPQPRDYRLKFNYKKKKLAYKHIFIKKYRLNQLSILKDIPLTEPNTSAAFQALVKLADVASYTKKNHTKSETKQKKISVNSNQNRKKVTIIVDKDKVEWKKSFKNIPWVQLIHIQRLSARHLLYNYGIFMTENAFKAIKDVV